METMEDYLDYLEYNGIYTQLDGREDQFISLTKWLNNFYEKKVQELMMDIEMMMLMI